MEGLTVLPGRWVNPAHLWFTSSVSAVTQIFWKMTHFLDVQRPRETKSRILDGTYPVASCQLMNTASGLLLFYRTPPSIAVILFYCQRVLDSCLVWVRNKRPEMLFQIVTYFFKKCILIRRGHYTLKPSNLKRSPLEILMDPWPPNNDCAYNMAHAHDSQVPSWFPQTLDEGSPYLLPVGTTLLSLELQ